MQLRLKLSDEVGGNWLDVRVSQLRIDFQQCTIEWLEIDGDGETDSLLFEDVIQVEVSE